MVFMFAPLAAGLCYFALRQVPASWPTFTQATLGIQRTQGAHAKASTPKASTPKASTPNASTAKADPGARSRPRTPWWALAATVAIAIAFTAWQMA